MSTMSTDPTAPDAASSDTSLAGSQAHILATSTAQVADGNQKRTEAYHRTYVKYVLNMTSGGFVPENERTPPKPPNALRLAKPDADGYVWPEVGPDPVCDPLPVPSYNGGIPAPNTEPNHIAIGKRNGPPSSKWFNALPGDTFPNGQTTPPDATSADGVIGAFEKFGGVASWGWYLQVS